MPTLVSPQRFGRRFRAAVVLLGLGFLAAHAVAGHLVKGTAGQSTQACGQGCPIHSGAAQAADPSPEPAAHPTVLFLLPLSLTEAVPASFLDTSARPRAPPA